MYWDVPVRFTLPDEEPAVGSWEVLDGSAFLTLLDAITAQVAGRPRVVAVEGRSAAGKSTLARALVGLLPGAVAVHTDDVAWYEPYFQWQGLLRTGVLEPVHRGEAVCFRPPSWVAKGRTGAVVVPAGSRWVVVEGVGAAQAAVADLVDAVIWVQSDFEEAERRGIARDIVEGVNGDEAESIAFWHEWMAEELVFLRRDRPWERADLVVAGTAPRPLAPGQLAVSRGPLGSPTA
jgi:energy-coupling factor transporter ATP-binding protein EcfA2